MEQHEDKIFLSGPFIKERALVDQGMTILHSDNEEEGAEFMRNEPLIKHGLRRFELRLWEVREGTVSIRISAAKSQGSAP
jgi:hypothetical protein